MRTSFRLLLSRLARIAILAIGLATIGTGSAFAVTCPDGVTDPRTDGTRSFTLGGTAAGATCLTHLDNTAYANSPNAITLLGYTALDTAPGSSSFSDFGAFASTDPLTVTNTSGWTSGTFSFTGAALSPYTQFVLALVSQNSPDDEPISVAFLLPAGVFSGTWEINNEQLRGALLYGIAAVPVPAGVILLGSALAALGLLGRRRRVIAA